MRKLRTIAALVAVLSLAAGPLLQQEVRVDERSVLAGLAPGVAFSEKAGSPLHYRSDSGVAAFNTHDVRPEIRGYAGPIKVLVVLGSDGRIKGLKILSHRETKNYVHYLETPAYLGRFIGKSVQDRFEIDKDIDGISRATVSVEALATSIRDSSRAVAADVYGIRTAPEGPAGAGNRSWLWYSLLVLFGLSGYVLTRRERQYRSLRDISLVASIAVVGLFLASPFSVLHIFNLVLLRPSSSLLWIVIVAARSFPCRSPAGSIAAGSVRSGPCPSSSAGSRSGNGPCRRNWTTGGATSNTGCWRSLAFWYF